MVRDAEDVVDNFVYSASTCDFLKKHLAGLHLLPDDAVQFVQALVPPELSDGFYIYTDGSHDMNTDEPAGWSAVVLLICHGASHFLGFLRGYVILDECHPQFLGATRHSNNTAEFSVMAWAIAFRMHFIPSEAAVCIRPDSQLAIDCALFKRRLSTNANLGHTLRAVAHFAPVFTVWHVKAHSGEPFFFVGRACGCCHRIMNWQTT